MSTPREKEEKKPNKGMLKSSQKMLIKKYLIEFDNISYKLGIGAEPDSPIHYTQFLTLMQQMCFVSEDHDTETDKLKVIWGMIQDQNPNFLENSDR